MNRGKVVMKGDEGLWTSDTHRMQHLGEALLHIPICGHRAPFLQWNGYDVSGFGNVRGNHLFTGAP